MKIALPAAAMMDAPCAKPGIAPSMSDCPRRSRMPAAGMTAIGRSRLRPRRWAFAKSFDCFFGVFFSGTSVAAAVLIGVPLVIGWSWGTGELSHVHGPGSLGGTAGSGPVRS